MVDVFISYSRANEAIVRQLAEAVTAEGYSVWWDAELPPHLSYGEVITEKIGSAKAAIVVWSKDAAASEWVRAEADVARGQKKLIQTSIDDVMPPMPFNQIQFASIGDWHGEADHPGWKKVKASLAALCGEGSGERVAMPERPPQSRRDPVAAAPAGRGPIIALLALLVILVGAGVAILWFQGREPEPKIVANDVSADNLKAAAEPTLEAEPVDVGPSRSTPSAEVDAVEADPEPSAVEQLPSRGRQGEILPDSDTRRLVAQDLEGLNRRQLLLARNEIFARHGRIFRNPVLARHFAQFDWYRPRSSEVALSAVEQANVQLIAAQESKAR
jgi:hypothetical protein